MKYWVLGYLVDEPTTAQHDHAAKTGGWKISEFGEVTAYWNACLSPPFAGAPYQPGETK